MKLRGEIATGVLRGSSLVDLYFPRIVGTLGFVPFRGTLNVKLEKDIDITLYSTKGIEHILMDGSRKVYAFLAPIIFTVKEENYNCWAMKEPQDTRREMIEVVAKDNLREKFSLKDGDQVEITFFEQPRKRRGIPGLGIMSKLYGIEPQLFKK